MYVVYNHHVKVKVEVITSHHQGIVRDWSKQEFIIKLIVLRGEYCLLTSLLF